MAQVMAYRRDNAMDEAKAAAENQDEWKRESVTHRHIIDLGEFAVGKYNKEHPSQQLRFLRVTNAESYTMAAVNYRLTISAEDRDGCSLYDAFVIHNDRPSTALKAFTKLN